MSTTYKSTIEVRCWKEHSCINCSGTFAYLFVRSVVGQAATPDGATTNARAAAVKAVKEDVDLQPCPTCGLYQPDMIGAQRARRHWRIFFATLGYLALLLIVFACRGLTANNVVWLAAAGSALAIAANFVVAWNNPNRNLDANQQLARRKMDSGRLQQGSAGNLESAPETRVASWSAFHWLVFIVMVAAVGLKAAPEVLREANGWPINEGWRSPVVGPGDESTIYLPDSIESVKSHWNGSPKVVASIAGTPNQGEFPVPAVSKADNWGDSISVKSSQKNSSSRLWVTVTVPNRPDLAGKKLKLKIDLTVTYPASAGTGFTNQQRVVNHTADLQLAPSNAGQQYTTIWQLGVLGGGGLLLAMNLALVGLANSLKRQAPPTNVYTVNDGQSRDQD